MIPNDSSTDIFLPVLDLGFVCGSTGVITKSTHILLVYIFYVKLKNESYFINIYQT